MKAFNDTKGQVQSGSVDYVTLPFGTTVLRLFGGILPMYQYWVASPAVGKNIPIECLQFDREKEAFDNSQEDPVKELGLKNPRDPSKDLTCQYGYKIQCINRATNKVEVLQLKTTILNGIKSVATQLASDPTDLESGFDLYIEKVKTGPRPVDVEYKVQEIACMKNQAPASAADKELVAAAKSLDELFPRLTAEKQRAELQKLMKPKEEKADGNSGGEAGKAPGTNDQEAMNELD